MKTETEIAKYFVKNIKKYGFRQSAEQHDEDCQRFLEFLEDLHNLKVRPNRIIRREATEGLLGNLKQYNKANLKYKDLQNAIKIYEDVGIK